jgi:hypothetical protein
LFAQQRGQDGIVLEGGRVEGALGGENGFREQPALGIGGGQGGDLDGFCAPGEAFGLLGELNGLRAAAQGGLRRSRQGESSENQIHLKPSGAVSSGLRVT